MLKIYFRKKRILYSWGILLLFMCFITSFSIAQNCNCADNLTWLIDKVENNYAGYFDKVNMQTEYKYTNIKDSLLTGAYARNGFDFNCYRLLKTYINYFNDPHLGLSFDISKYRSEIGDVFKRGFPEKKNYAGNQKNSSEKLLSGTWKDNSGTFDLKFEKVAVDSFIGYIVKSNIPQWHNNQVKIEIRSFKGRYFVRFYTRDHTIILDTLSTIDDEIKVAYQAALFRKGKAENTPGNLFLFKLMEKEIGYFRLPNFLPQNRYLVDSILREYTMLKKPVKNFIIDIRNNTGGSSICYEPFLPYIYTDSVKIYGSATRKSEANIQFYASSINDSSFPESYRNAFARFASQLRNAPGLFLRTDSLSYFIQDTVFSYPKRIVFLINDRCFSAAEFFLNYATQSRKVVLMGGETYGGLNYVAVNSDLRFPCQLLGLNYPISRSNRVDMYPISRGIKPAVYLPQPEREWIGFAVKYLMKEKAK
jgi:hypothetical protein